MEYLHILSCCNIENTLHTISIPHSQFVLKYKVCAPELMNEWGISEANGDVVSDGDKCSDIINNLASVIEPSRYIVL